MKNLIEINDNINRNVDYSVDFFQYSDYELTIEDPTMIDDGSWINFLNNTDLLRLPLKNLSSFTKTQKLWMRNKDVVDKLTLQIDESLDNNLIEFIARKTKYKSIELKSLRNLGCIINMDYINNYGIQSTRRLYVGRISNYRYTNRLLTLTIGQLDKIMDGSDFEKNVIKSPTGSFYNYISLKQAFANIYNVPHNIIDRYSYAATPFRLDESTYLPENTQDITITDGNLDDNFYVYAEDTVANTDEYIHTQFYYHLNSPQCGLKMTTYDDAGDVINTETSEVLGWNIWENSQEAYDRLTPGYFKDLIFNYQRYFRPFKVVIAGEEETTMFDDGNYRIVRNVVFGSGETPGGTNNDYYEPIIQNEYWRQVPVDHGEYICREGDRLIYFEQLGDVRFRDAINNQESVNILYDNTSTVYVYNLDRDIVYFNHITSLVSSIPLPKQWLQMQQYISTETLSYASRLDYESEANNYYSFWSYIKPFCAIPHNGGSDHGLRYELASTRSFKYNQNDDGGGAFGGEVSIASLGFGIYDVSSTNGTPNNALDYSYIEAFLDSIVRYNKPKSIRFSPDGKTISFLKGFYSGFDVYQESWPNPSIVALKDRTKVYQLPKAYNYASKGLYITGLNGFQLNQREWDTRGYLTYEDGNFPLVNEICDNVYSESMALLDHPFYNSFGEYQNGKCFVNVISVNTNTESDSLQIASNRIIPSVNFYNGPEPGFTWCLDPIIWNQLTVYKTFDVSWKVLDYNGDINRAIIQKPTDLIYYDTLNDVELFTKSIVGFDYLLSMDRDRLLFTNPLYGQSGEIIRIGSVINEPVRLLSFSGNRYLAGSRLAASFIKNTFYDGDGVLNIGWKPQKFELTDYDLISDDIFTTNYDVIEYTSSTIEKNGFKQLDNDDASNLEEDELEYDESISITMWANTDVQMDITVTRTTNTNLHWSVYNQFTGKDSSGDTIYEEGDVTINGWNQFSFELTGIFEGIIITCDFYNTDLAQGEKFRGTIDRRMYVDNIIPDEIVDVDDEFPFLDDDNLSLKFPFLYSLNSKDFFDNMNDYFIYANSIRDFVTLTIEVPTLLYFDLDYKPFEIGSIITISDSLKYVNGYSLDDGIITPYNQNKNDYYIESLSYDIKNGKTKLKLIGV